MIAAVMTMVFRNFSRVVLVDADTGTGGLSYYFGLKLVSNTAIGIADLVFEKDKKAPLPLQSINWKQSGDSKFSAKFLGIGNHRRLYRAEERESLAINLRAIIERVKRETVGDVVVDCRGGIDPESIAVCEAADDIILIVEPDTTSFQATQYVVDVLSDKNLAGKLRGFIINKVFDDPSTVANYGTSVFKCSCLAAVPFDLDATRDFLIGDIPRLDTQFGVQIWQALRKAYPEILLARPPGRPWTFQEFSQVSLTSPESSRGGLVVGSALLILGAGAFIGLTDEYNDLLGGPRIMMLVFAVLGIMGSLEPTRRLVGRMFGFYVKMLSFLLGIRSKR